MFGKKVIKNFFTYDEIQKIKIEITSLEIDVKDYIWKYYEQDGNLNKIEYFIKYNTNLKKLSISEKIIDEVTKLMGERSLV